MNILHKLTLQNLKQNKKRTIVTIIGILLSTALICAVAGLAQSGLTSLINWAKHTDGDYHVLFIDVPEDKISYITSNVHVKDSFSLRGLGYAQAADSGNPNKPYFYIMEADDAAFAHISLRLLSGRLPENAGEIVIPDHVFTSGDMEYRIGDTLTLEVGTRMTDDGWVLGQHNPFDPDEGEPESIVNTAVRTYTIVGISERLSYMLENYDAPGFVLLSRMEGSQTGVDGSQAGGTRTVGVTYDKPKHFQDYTDEIMAVLDAEGDSTTGALSNHYLLELEGALSARTTGVLYSLAAVILVIILVTSVYVIRNSFAISVSEKTQQYGMLASVGATAKQIRGSILYEGLIIGLIGIPLGIALGVAAVMIVLQIMNVLLKDMFDGMTFVYSVPVWVFLLTIFLAALTIWLSCLVPAVRAGQITPIEAIRGNREVKIDPRKLRTTPLIRRLFGTGGVIADKNLKRSRAKYRTTVVSLVLSISVFVALSSFVSTAKRSTYYYFTDYGFNIQVLGDETAFDDLLAEVEVDKSIYYRAASATADVSYLSEEWKDVFDNMSDLYASIAVLPDARYVEFAHEYGLPDTVAPGTALLWDTGSFRNEDGTKIVARSTILKAGDQAVLKFTEYDDETGEAKQEIPLSVTVAGILDKAPMGMEGYTPSGGTYIMPESAVPGEIVKNSYAGALYINDADPDRVEKEIVALKAEDSRFAGFDVMNAASQVRQERNFILVIEIFLYGFITVITLIGVTNIFNTISTNMILRRKEFAMLKSVGMTNRQFKGMIFVENILYSLKSLAIGLPLGVAGSWLLYRLTSDEIDMGYFFPWKPILFACVFVFLIVGLTMLYSLRKIESHNIVETIRNDNI